MLEDDLQLAWLVEKAKQTADTLGLNYISGHRETSSDKRDYGFEYSSHRSAPAVPQTAEVVQTAGNEQLNYQQTKSRFEQLLQGKESQLSIEELTKYSMGIPFLIELFVLNIESLTLDQAVLMTAMYWRHLLTHENVTHFTNPLPFEAQDKIVEWLKNDFRIFTALHLYSGFEEQITLAKQGIKEPCPVPVDPKSMEMYKEMLSAKGQHINQIEFFIPEDNPQVKKSLGLDQITGLSSDTLQGPRWEMCGVDDRPDHKFFLGADREGHEFGRVDPGGLRRGQGRSKLSEQGHMIQFREKIATLPDLPTEFTAQNMPGYLYVRNLEHRLSNFLSIQLGCMMESLLQNTNTPYVAFNNLLNVTYYWDTRERKIKTLNNENI